MEFERKYGVATHIYIPIPKRAVVDFAVGADWTPAAGDVKISKDGGAAANVTNLPTAIVMGNTAMWDFSLTATEMSAAQICVTIADSATKAVEDQFYTIATYGNASARHAADFNDAVALGLSRLDAAVTTRMATFTLPTNFSSLSISAGGLVDILQTSADKVWSSTTRTLTALGSSLVAEIWNALLTGITTVASVGKLIKDNLDAAISTRSTYAGTDTAGTGTLLTRLSATRAGLLDNLDAAVSTRSTYAGADTAGTTTLLSRLTATRAGLLDNLDAAISSRSTYAGADTAGTTTLLTRLSAIRAALIDNLDATISSRLAASGYTAPDNTSIAAIKTQTDKLVFTNVGRLDVQLRGCDVGIIDAAALASDAEAEIVAALKTAAFDGSYTFQQLVQIATAAVAAKLSGVGTGTIVVRDISDTKDIITMTVAAGGRTAVTFNV